MPDEDHKTAGAQRLRDLFVAGRNRWRCGTRYREHDRQANNGRERSNGPP
jgi:hypothetical protein